MRTRSIQTKGLPLDNLAKLSLMLRTSVAHESDPALNPHLLEVIDATAGAGAVTGPKCLV